MALYSYLRVTFLCLAGIFFLLTLFLATWQKKWKRLGFDIFVCLIQMPLWIILGIAILRFFPDLSYSYFPGIWMITGAVLWITPHCIMTAKAIHRKDRFDTVCSVAGILAIISFTVISKYSCLHESCTVHRSSTGGRPVQIMQRRCQA